jgi:hypothetical protein
MDRRKMLVLAGVLALVALVNVVPGQADDCGEVFQATPECTEGCISAAQMAALLSIPVATASACLEEYRSNGRLEDCTPSGGGQGYCRL